MTTPSGSSRGGTASPEQAAGQTGAPRADDGAAAGPEQAYDDPADGGDELALDGDLDLDDELDLDGGLDLDEEPDQEPGRPARRDRHRRRPRSRRSRRWRRAFFGLIVAGLLAAAGWALFLSPYLVVRSVLVTGNSLVPQSEVLAAARVTPGTPLIRVNTGQVAARVSAITELAGASVSRSWPDRLVIAVRERVPAMAVTLPGGGYDLVDAHGVLVRQVASLPAGLPLFSAPADVSSPRGNPDVAAAAAVLAELPARLQTSVRSVTAPSPSQVTLHLAHGVTVLWGSPGQASVKAEELNALMHTHASYYDVSDPGSVTTK